jgi:L-rhamnose mutarotase
MKKLSTFVYQLTEEEFNKVRSLLWDVDDVISDGNTDDYSVRLAKESLTELFQMFSLDNHN